MDTSDRRLVGGVLMSVLLHALVLSLQFGVPGLRAGAGSTMRIRLTPPAASEAVPDAVTVKPVPVPVPVPVLGAPPVAVLPPMPPLPATASTPALPAKAAPEPAHQGFTLVDPVAPAPLPAAPPTRTIAPAPRRPAKRRKPRSTTVADGLHTRVIAQDIHQDTDFNLPLPAVESAPETLAREEPATGADEAVEDTVAQALARREDELEQARTARREADEAALRVEAEAALRRDTEAQNARLAAQSAQADADLAQRQQEAEAQGQRALAERQAAEAAQVQAAQVQAVREEEQKRLAAQQRAHEAEQALALQMAGQQRAEEAEQERARQLAERRRVQHAEQEPAQQLVEQRGVEQAEQERAQQLAEQRRLRQAEQERGQQLAEQRRAQQAEQERERQLAEQRRAEQAEAAARQQLAEQRRARQAEEGARLAREQAEQQRAGELAAATAPGRTAAGSGAGPAGDGPGAARLNGQGSVELPPGALGGNLASRARELLRGIDIAKPVPALVRPAEDAARALRRALAEAGRSDVPLRLYIDSIRQKIERNAVVSNAQLATDDVRTDPLVSIAIRSDGSVEDVIILRSSGRVDIDELVRRVIHLNARYAAFPANVAAHYDVVEVRRVWRFAGVLRLLEEMR